MQRHRALLRFFWEQVAGALQASTWSISPPGGSGRSDALSGVLGGFAFETGAYAYGGGADTGRVERSYAFVVLKGLPPGLEIDAAPSFQRHAKVDVSCDDGTTRTVTVRAVPVDIDGLRLEQFSVDLDMYLTRARRRAICALDSDLHWRNGYHELRSELDGLPYPGKRKLRRAMSGESEAFAIMSQHRDRVVSLVQMVVREADLISRQLDPTQDSGDAPSDERIHDTNDRQPRPGDSYCNDCDEWVLAPAPHPFDHNTEIWEPREPP